MLFFADEQTAGFRMSHSENNRTRFTFSLRTFLFGFATVICVFSFIGFQLRRYKAREAAYQQLESEHLSITAYSGKNWLGEPSEHPYFLKVSSVLNNYNRDDQSKLSPLALSSLSEFPELETVGLSSTLITDEDLYYLRNLRQLNTLSLITCKYITGSGFEYLDSLPLTELELVGTSVDDAGLLFISKLRHLRLLGLYNCPVTDAGVGHLRGLSELSYLDLTNTKVGDAGVRKLVELDKLDVLSLGHTKITDEGLRHLSKMQSLRVLNLDETHITDQGLVYLQELKSLEYLDIPHTQATQEGVDALQAANPKLKIEHSLNWPDPSEDDQNLFERDPFEN